MWNPSFINEHIILAPQTQAWRVLPTKHLLLGAAVTSATTANGLFAAIRRQRAQSSDELSNALDAFDDSLAFVFKHPGVQGSSRFSAAQPLQGTLYASFTPRAALAERAFQHLRFIREQGAQISSHVPTTQIGFDLRPMQIIDVRTPPFDQEKAFRDPGVGYKATQAFAAKVRKTSADGIVYMSVRDIEQGANIAIFTVASLASQRLDRRRVRDWFVSAGASHRSVIIQSTSGAIHHFAFDSDGRPV